MWQGHLLIRPVGVTKVSEWINWWYARSVFGRGTDELLGVMDRVHIVNSTLGKALGGAAGKAQHDIQLQSCCDSSTATSPMLVFSSKKCLPNSCLLHISSLDAHRATRWTFVQKFCTFNINQRELMQICRAEKRASVTFYAWHSSPASA